jgi:hypothetical protein
VLCWVAADRGASLAQRRGEHAHAARWRAAADEIHADVCSHAVDARGVFTQHYETGALDAAALLIPLMGFLPADDPRVRATVEAIADELTEDGLVLRYRLDQTEDGVSGEEGTFVICSFWLASALVAIGELERGRDLCQRMLGHVSDLGLLAEQLDAHSGRHLGNFPQAFSHLALINTVMAVIRAEADQGAPSRDGAATPALMAARPHAGEPSRRQPEDRTPPPHKEHLMGILGWIILGLVAGAIAKAGASRRRSGRHHRDDGHRHRRCHPRRPHRQRAEHRRGQQLLQPRHLADRDRRRPAAARDLQRRRRPQPRRPDVVNADVAAVRELAEPAHGGPVLSVHLRTDPRDPANTNHVPGWLVALRNGLRAVTQELEHDGSRRTGWPCASCATVSRGRPRARAVGPRARLALFASADGGIDRGSRSSSRRATTSCAGTPGRSSRP